MLRQRSDEAIKGAETVIIDCHIHYAASLEEERLNAIIAQYKLEGICLLCIPKGNGEETLQDALDFQKQAHIPVYLLGGIRRSLYTDECQALSDALIFEVDRLMRSGCQGIKMLEGKPDVRKGCSVPDFDDPVWDAYWTKLEDGQIPLLFHVNDPEEFWDVRKATEAARIYGWVYDETYINNEEQYRQILAVLERHPKLKVIFPHFFFLSKQLTRLSAILDRFPNVAIDITPGIELYYNLSERMDDAKAFFERYQDRICYGSDIGGRQIISKTDVPLSMEESCARIKLITRFLEESGDYLLEPDGYYVRRPPTMMHGLGLSECILEKVYQTNILKFLGIFPITP